MMTKDKLRQLTGDERLGQMRESEYLGAEDIDDGTEPVLTIAGLWYGSVTLQRGKENKDVLSIKEERVPGILQVRPLIVNSTNRKTLRKLFGDAKASTLVGKQIQLYPIPFPAGALHPQGQNRRQRLTHHCGPCPLWPLQSQQRTSGQNPGSARAVPQPRLSGRHGR